MELEIKVMWCKGLTGFNFFQKLSIYANVSIKHQDNRLDLTQQQKQEQRTPVDDDGDGNPEWNHTLTFDLRPLGPGLEHLSIVFELRHQGQLFGDKTVGQVHVPLRTLIDSIGCNVTRFVSYEVRTPDGKHNGILDFSYKVSTNEINSQTNNVRPPIHISGYNEHGVIQTHQHQQHYRVEQYNSCDSDRIQYPRIDMEEYYPPPPVVYPQYQWGPHHFPAPPPPGPPVVYHPPHYGDPHWGYYRPPRNNQPNW